MGECTEHKLLPLGYSLISFFRITGQWPLQPSVLSFNTDPGLQRLLMDLMMVSCKYHLIMQLGTHTFSQDVPQWHFILSRLLLEINMWISGISKMSHHTLLIHATGWRLWLGRIYSKQIYLLWNASEKLDGNDKNKFSQHTVNKWVSITGKEWGKDIKQSYFPQTMKTTVCLSEWKIIMKY